MSRVTVCQTDVAADFEPRGWPARFFVQLALASVLVLGFAKLYALDTVSFLMPLVRAELSAFDGNLSIASLELERQPTGDTVRMRSNLRAPVFVNTSTIYPLGWKRGTEGFYQNELNATSFIQSSLIFLIVVLSWPVRSLREAALRLAAMLPLLLTVFTIDKPLDLLGNFWQTVVTQVDPGAVHPLFGWAKFLEGGGSTGLAVAIAVVAIGIGRRSVP